LWLASGGDDGKPSATATFGAFACLRGSRSPILYDNTKSQFARILGDGKRHGRGFTGIFQITLLFDRSVTWPSHDKGKVEGLVGSCAPKLPRTIPVFDSFEALNAPSAALPPSNG